MDIRVSWQWIMAVKDAINKLILMHCDSLPGETW